MLGDFGDDLHAAGAGADTATRLPVRSTVASHCAVCISVAGEVGEAVDVGIPRGAEQSDRADDDVGDDAVSPLGPARRPSAALSAFQRSLRTRGAEHQVAAQVEVVGDRLQVGEDLRLIGVGAAPCPVGRERERIQVALDIAGRARDRCSAARFRRRRRRAR